MEDIVDSQWPILSIHLIDNNLRLIGENLCNYLDITHKHNQGTKLFYKRIVLRTHTDQLRRRLDRPIHNINFRALCSNHMIQSFCIKALKLCDGEDANRNYKFPLPLTTSTFNLYSTNQYTRLNHITCFDALSIIHHCNTLETLIQEDDNHGYSV